jgi:hypothetical protein
VVATATFCVGLALGATLTGSGGGDAVAAADSEPSPTPSVDTRLSQAYTACVGSGDGFELADGDTTLVIDTKGDDDYAGVDYSTLACALDELGTPTRVVTAIESTRALDGRQSDSWDGFAASWSYHPDTGMDLIVSFDEQT